MDFFHEWHFIYVSFLKAFGKLPCLISALLRNTIFHVSIQSATSVKLNPTQAERVFSYWILTAVAWSGQDLPRLWFHCLKVLCNHFFRLPIKNSAHETTSSSDLKPTHSYIYIYICILHIYKKYIHICKTQIYLCKKWDIFPKKAWSK